MLTGWLDSDMEKLHAGQMIEWKDLDKKKFYVIGPSFFMLVRGLIYPFNLIKTRLFVQQQTNVYNGTADAFRKIIQLEGLQGLYKGFLFSTFGMISGQLYITTYEVVRSQLKGYRSEIKGLIAGGVATLAGQTVTVPIDVVSQIMMMQGQVVKRGVAQYVVVKNVDYIIPQKEGTIKLKGALNIMKDILQQEGIQGLYRGYHVSLLTYAPNSALWWSFYTGFFRKSMESDFLASSKVPVPVIQALCGTCSALVASTLTNPLDVFRTRYQVEM